MTVSNKSGHVNSQAEDMLDKLDKFELPEDTQYRALALKLQAMQVRATLLLVLAVDEVGDFARDSAIFLDYLTDHLHEVGQPT